MSESTDKTPSFSVNQSAPNAGLVFAPGLVAKAEGSMPSRAADRLYQLAALTTGIFLLATML